MEAHAAHVENELPYNHMSCYKHLGIEWDAEGSGQPRLRITFPNELIARAYRKILRRNRFHRGERTKTETAGHDVWIQIPADVTKIRVGDSLRGFVFVFSSRGMADEWETNTMLWRRYRDRKAELCLDPYLNGTDSSRLRTMCVKLEEGPGPGEQRSSERGSRRGSHHGVREKVDGDRGEPRRRREVHHEGYGEPLEKRDSGRRRHKERPISSPTSAPLDAEARYYNKSGTPSPRFRFNWF
ncbi:hypothetical protein B0T25DRAFT_559696, partial [Lasiosphaeria hispida]